MDTGWPPLDSKVLIWQPKSQFWSLDTFKIHPAPTGSLSLGRYTYMQSGFFPLRSNISLALSIQYQN